MPGEFPKDPRHIWQNQPTERFQMSEHELRRRTEEHQKKARDEVKLSVGLGAVLCFFFAYSAIRTAATIPRIGWVVLSLWCVYFAYQSYKWVWPHESAPDPATGTSLHFYRGLLEKRLEYGRHIWRRSGLTFCFLGVAMVLVPGIIQLLPSPRALSNTAPFFILLAVWAVLFARNKKRSRRRLQQEIDELRALEREP